MENFSRYLDGQSVIDIWGATAKLDSIADPTPEDLESEEFKKFLDLVLRDALGEDYKQVG